MEIFWNSIYSTLFTVGNIPYEATEEKLKEIFSEVGPVLSLKWVPISKIFVKNRILMWLYIW